MEFKSKRLATIDSLESQVNRERMELTGTRTVDTSEIEDAYTHVNAYGIGHAITDYEHVGETPEGVAAAKTQMAEILDIRSQIWPFDCNYWELNLQKPVKNCLIMTIKMAKRHLAFLLHQSGFLCVQICLTQRQTRPALLPAY